MLLFFSLLLSGVHTCFVCKTSGSGVKRCIIPLCGKFYHNDCILAYSATQPHNKGSRCPLHVCLSCHITNPLNICSTKGKTLVLMIQLNDRHFKLFSNETISQELRCFGSKQCFNWALMPLNPLVAPRHVFIFFLPTFNQLGQCQCCC